MIPLMWLIDAGLSHDAAGFLRIQMSLELKP